MKRSLIYLIIGLLFLVLVKGGLQRGGVGELRKEGEEESVSLVFSSSQEEISPGEEFLVDVNLNTGEKIAGVDLQLDYSSQLLVLEEIIPSLGTNQAFTDQVWQEVKEEEGRARLILVAKRSDQQLKKGVVKVAKIRFRARSSSGKAVITFLPSSLILGKDGYLPLAPFSPLEIRIREEKEKKGLSLQFKVVFQGALPASSPVTAKIKFKKGEWDSGWFEGISFYPAGRYYQSGMEFFPGVVPGEGYQIIIKGSKHLARSFCGLEKTSCQKGEGLTLSAGPETIDLTFLPLLPGDLPDPENHFLQDGVVNAVDLVLIKNRLGSTRQEDLEIADVDFSGIISGRDISLVLKTLQSKEDVQ